MKNSLRLKAGAFLTTAFGVILVSGITGGITFAADTLPAGFKKGDLAPEPSADMIEAGKRVYFTKCVWCHGVDGAGDGPGADRLWPRPRNFNQGTFKIRHTASGELPLFDAKKPVLGQNDLFDTVTHGLPGSAMPSWEGILTEEQRLQVLSFVTTQLVKDRKFTDKQSESQTILQLADLKPIPATEESLKKGAELVVEKKCVECHGADGRGDGNAFNLKDDWGFSIQPANWHKCWNFRGSRQDPYNVKNIFRTFSTGVNGTPMPSFADNTTVEERWHIANFVNSLCEREADGTPLAIDLLTDKPKVNFVLSSGVIEGGGEIPADPENELWQKRARRIIAMGGQITHKPRNFVNRIDDIWMKSLYNDTHIAFMFQWDDRTKSVAEGKLPWPPTSVNIDVKEQDPKTGEEGSIAMHQNNYTVYNDAVAMETAVKWKELPAPIKPRYLFGSNEQFPMDIMKWEADGSLRAFKGTGWDKDFEERDNYEESSKLLFSEWKNGRWTVIIQRPLGNKKDQDYDEDTFFEMGQYIPTVFFAWDGHNGDAGRKMAVSAFYYTFLEPPTPREAYIYPIVIACGVVLLEGWVLTRRSNKRKGKTL
ncbi:MAG: c-type cytochrome [Nitrospirae bacterium]|nr:c-type cytochrome [Nitrospirota bacterium]